MKLFLKKKLSFVADCFLLSFILIILMSSVSCRQDSSDDSGLYLDGLMNISGAGSADFARNLGAGWNLGNTLDASSVYYGADNLGLSTETSWGLPYTTKAMMKAVADKGFKCVRIPVSWHNHIVDKESYKIDSKWLSRVTTIADWALDYGMYVIINIHHDNMSESDMAKVSGFCVTDNTSLQEKSRNFLSSVWKQVSEAFAEYNYGVIFEVMNEPRAVGTSYEWWPGDNASRCNKIISNYAQVCVNSIRAGGGYNADRYIMIPTYAANPSCLDGWSLPSDSASGKLLVSVHSYDPSVFGLGDSSVTALPSYAENSIRDLYEGLAGRFMSKGIGVVMGETSCSDKNNYEERKKWFQFVKKYASRSGIPYVLWDNDVVYPTGNDAGERHGYFNRKNLSWYFPELIGIFIR